RVGNSRRQDLGYRTANNNSSGASSGSRRRTGGIPSGDDIVRLARDPRDAGRLPHHDDQDLEPLPVSAKAGTGRRGVIAASSSHRDPPARGTHGAGPARLFGRWGEKQRTAYR